MVEASKAVCYVSLYDPDSAFPGTVDFSKCCVASPTFAEAVGMFAECPIEIGIQDHSHYFCQELIAPDGHTERPLFPVLFYDVGSSCWLPLILFLPQAGIDVFNIFHPGSLSLFSPSP